MKVQEIAVMGAGQMGNGIAQVAAEAGFTVVMRDVEDRFVERGLATIRKNLDRAVEKGRATREVADAALARIRPTTDLKAAANADLVVEAIIENLDLKRKLWTDLDGIVKPGAVFASNTSSIPITVLAAATKRPKQFVGMHFFNPVPVMKLVELIRGVETSDETVAVIRGAGERMGKTVVEVQDYPGFVSNRVLMPMINEAVFALHEGVGTPEAIDTVMKLGMNHPMGPLELADFIGLDTCLSILDVLHDGFKDPKYRPCPLLAKKVQAGHLGRKVGRGFYRYDEKGRIAGPA
ncbi:MAG TPA: 3-hydroxybutyryl-CoA dehydrogenase [Candidatus Thermoplasmatota archaeon]|nr:3-hydroxybutyryl-CoA dehydrogenase [Candidatus Thermoplasmatota archaeon]